MTSLTSKHWPWIVTGFLTLLVWLQTCRYNKVAEKLDIKTEQVTQLDLERQGLKTIVNNQEDAILTQRAIVVSHTQTINSLTDSIFDLKKKDAKNQETIVYWKSRTKVRLDTIRIPYEKPSSIADRLKFSDSIMRACKEVIDFIESQTVPIQTVASVSNDSLTLRATILKEGLQIDSLVIPNETHLRFVEKKHGWFKPRTIEVQFFNTNPLFKTEQANSVIYRPKKKSFWKTVALPVAIGVGAGLILSK